MIAGLIPWACGLFVSSGLAGLWWYSTLSKDQQVAADRRASELALSLYETSIDCLTKSQLDHVHSLVKKQFIG